MHTLEKTALHVTAGSPVPPLVPWLQTLNLPSALNGMDIIQLTRVTAAVRDVMVKAVAKTGGHLGAGLGVVELTVALHSVFNTPDDKIIWDVGHQAYPHKILTGRMDKIETLRQGGGLSGFTKRSESVFDPFGAAHSSTSISAGLGMAVARDLAGHSNKVIAVIGDGAMTAGMAYEAMNNAGYLNANMLVILNDNDMSIAPPTGALSRHLSRLVSSSPFLHAREFAKKIVSKLPDPIQKAAARAEETLRVAGSGTLFESLGFYYIGPVDGHDLETLLPLLKNWRDGTWDGPVLLHIRTQKGKGYAPAENAADKMHGVTKFCVVTGTQDKGKPANAPSYTNVFAETLSACAETDPKIVAVTAAMPSGTGLDTFAKAHASKCFDVGIAEQHAVTFAAGLATEGFKPFCAIYSTFLQRAYDQVVHDVCLQNLPVRFAIDRAGLVGADGATHAGAFDVAYLGSLPNMVLMAASDEAELARMVVTAVQYNAGPIAFRYPRGNGVGVEMPANPQPLDIGKGRVVRAGTDVALLSFGTRLQACLEAAEQLQAQGISVTVADARFAKPLDTALVNTLATTHKALVTVEEGSGQGFGAIVLQHLAQAGALDNGQCKIRTLHLPDIFQDHDTQDKQYAEAGLNAPALITTIKQLLA